MERACLALVVAALCACAAERTAPVSTAPGLSTDGAAERPAPATAPAPVVAPAPATPPTAEGPARWDGYRTLRLGMSADAARAAWGGELRGDAITPDACGYLVPVDVRDGSEFGLMFEGGRLVRYDVGTPRDLAPGGGRVGMSRTEVESLYAGRVDAQPHEYVPGAHYLRVVDAGDAQRALVFETDEQGRITRWRVGQAPQVDYVEGCA